MRVVVAPDKFKGSLPAAAAAAALSAGLRRNGADAVPVPVADGGDGTVAAALAAGWEAVSVSVSGPTRQPVATQWARSGNRAVVELASACGLERLPEGKPDALGASSHGLGEVIAAALDAGCRDVIVGIGGSAGTDGGAGMLQALGYGLTDAGGGPPPPGGGALGTVVALDDRGLHPAVGTTRFRVACDVDNPLCGPHGAATVYGPQKGASREDIELLDGSLARWAELVAPGRMDEAGAGAAGGVGFAALTVLRAELRPGIDVVLDLLHFDQILAGADLVVTGEGSLDGQTLRGKAVAGVATAARRHGIPVVAVAGRVALSADDLAAVGIERAYSLGDLEPDPSRSMVDAAALLERVGERIALEAGTARYAPR